MLTAGHTSVPEIRSPLRTVAIISVVTFGLGYLWWKHKKSDEENEDRTV